MTPVVLDLIISVVILLSMGIAYMRGIIREIFTIVGLGGATFASYKGGHLLIPEFNKIFDVQNSSGAEAAEMVSRAGDTAGTEALATAIEAKKHLVLGVMSPELAAQASAYGSVFIVIFLLFTIASYSLTHLVKEAGLGVLDRLGGAGFGFARGFLFVFLLYLPCTILIDQDRFPVWAKNSKSVPILEKTFVWADGKFKLRDMIEDEGDGVAIKLDKIDPEQIKSGMGEAEYELRQELSQEERGLETP
jgi:uncharacterized membrane protein required for colicin V production